MRQSHPRVKPGPVFTGSPAAEALGGPLQRAPGHLEGDAVDDLLPLIDQAEYARPLRQLLSAERGLALEAALGRRNPTQPPRNLEPAEDTRGATDRSVTPRQDLVELRGLEPLTPRLPALCSPS